MVRWLPVTLVLLGSGLVVGQEATTYEKIVQKHARERTAVAHIKSKTVALKDLEELLGRQASELDSYASSAPLSSANLARAKALDYTRERTRLLLERNPVIEKDLRDTEDERTFALLVEQACCESQEKLVAVLDARARAKKIALRGPGAVLLDGAQARALGVHWGRVELIVDRSGTLRGVDLVGAERQNLLGEVKREVPK